MALFLAVKQSHSSKSSSKSNLRTFLIGLCMWTTILILSVLFGFIHEIIGGAINSKSTFFYIHTAIVLVIGFIAVLQTIGWISKHFFYKQEAKCLDANHLKIGWAIAWRGLSFYIFLGVAYAFITNVMAGLKNQNITEYAFPLSILGIFIGLYSMGWAVERVGTRINKHDDSQIESKAVLVSSSVPETARSQKPETLEHRQDFTKPQKVKGRNNPTHRKTSANIKHAWIIPVIICLALLAAWPFRWEKGPTQTQSGNKVVHLRDRWTGQNWYVLYGAFENKFHSGETVPYFSKSKIKATANEILKEPEKLNKERLIETQIRDAKETRANLTQGHNKYIALKKQFESEFITKYPKPELDSDYKTYRSSFEKALEEFEESTNQENEYLDAKFKYIDSKMPNDLYKQYKAWQEQNNLIAKLDSNLKALQTKAEKEAKKRLNVEAYHNRKLATNVWIAAFIMDVLCAVILFFRSDKKKPIQV